MILTNGNIVYTDRNNVNYLAISCFDEKAELTIKAWLLERNVAFEGKIPCWIVIPYGMAAIGMTAFDLAQQLAVATGVATQMLVVNPPIEHNPNHVGIGTQNVPYHGEGIIQLTMPTRHRRDWKFRETPESQGLEQLASSPHLDDLRRQRDIHVFNYIGEKPQPFLLFQLWIMEKLFRAIALVSSPKLKLLILQKFWLP